MSKKFLVSIDLNQNELQNAVIQNLATAPSSPSEGQVYYDSSTGDKSVYFYNGSSWVDIGGAVQSLVAGDAIAVSGSKNVTVDVVYDDVTIGVNGSNQVYVKDGGISNAKLANSSLTVTAGSGLTGGGSISLGSSATVNVGAGTGIVVNADDIALDYAGTDNFIDSATDLEGTAIDSSDTIIYHDATDSNVKKGLVSDLPFGTGTVTSVAISGSDGIDVDSGSPITTSGTIALGLSNVPNSSLANSSVTVTAGSGLVNGGSVSLGGSVTVNVGAGTGITVNADDVQLKNAASLTDETISVWDSTNGQFIDSSITDDGTTVTIGGNLTVQGTTTTVDSTTVAVGDNIIVLNKDEAGTPSLDAGIEIERGTSTNVSFLWDESADTWSTVTEAFHIGSIASAGASYSGNEYLVSDSGVVKYLTSSELADDVAGGFTFTEGEGIDISGSGTSTITISGEDASTTNKGIVELATQTETRALSSTTLAVTPNALQGLRYAATGPSSTSASFVATHNLGSTDVIVQVYDVATAATVECDVVRTDNNNVTLSFATAQGASSLRILVIKIA